MGKKQQILAEETIKTIIREVGVERFFMLVSNAFCHGEIIEEMGGYLDDDDLILGHLFTGLGLCSEAAAETGV